MYTLFFFPGCFFSQLFFSDESKEDAVKKTKGSLGSRRGRVNPQGREEGEEGSAGRKPH